jgi:hypothetical protein
MAKSDYVIQSDDPFAAQLQTFKNSIGSYAATLGVTPAEVTAQAADADYFNYAVACQAVMSNGAQQWTGWKRLSRNGGAPPPGGVPVVPPVFPASVAAVAPGIEARFRALVKRIKAHPNYNESVGEALGIEGPDQVAPDLTTIKPDINAKVTGNQVLIEWGWGKNAAFLDLCEIQVDRNDNKGFVLLAYDSTPNYIDTQSFPSSPAKWTYRAIYRVGDSQVGQWSKPVSVTVGG